LVSVRRKHPALYTGKIRQLIVRSLIAKAAR
jgi:hypothetical protein